MKENKESHYQSWPWEYVKLKTWIPQYGYSRYLMQTELLHYRNMNNPEKRKEASNAK